MASSMCMVTRIIPLLIALAAWGSVKAITQRFLLKIPIYDPFCKEEFDRCRYNPTVRLNELTRKDRVDNMCRSMTRNSQCFSVAAFLCRGDDKLLPTIQLKTVEELTAVLCSDKGRQILQAEAQCWGKFGFGQAFSQCSLSVNVTDPRENKDVFCNTYLKQMKSCVSQVTRDKCNSQVAVTFVQQLVSSTLGPMLTLYGGCEDGTGL